MKAYVLALKNSKKEFDELISEKYTEKGDVTYTTRNRLAKKFKDIAHIKLFINFFELNPHEYKVKRIRW